MRARWRSRRSSCTIDWRRSVDRRRSRCALLGLGLAVTAVAAACGEPASQSGSDATSRSLESTSVAPHVDSAPGDPSTEQGDSIAGVSVAYDKPLDAAHRLVVEVVQPFDGWPRLRVVLVDRGDTSRRWVIDSTAGVYADDHVVRSVTASEAVVCRLDGYSSERSCTKFFYVPAARRAHNRVEFARGSLSFKDAAEAQRVLAVSAAGYARLEDAKLFDDSWVDETGPPGDSRRIRCRRRRMRSSRVFSSDARRVDTTIPAQPSKRASARGRPTPEATGSGRRSTTARARQG